MIIYIYSIFFIYSNTRGEKKNITQAERDVHYLLHRRKIIIADKRDRPKLKVNKINKLVFVLNSSKSSHLTIRKNLVGSNKTSTKLKATSKNGGDL